MDAIELIMDALEELGQSGVNEAAGKLKVLAGEPGSEWRAIALQLASEAVAFAGPKGIDLAHQAILDLLDGKNADLSFADLRTSHAIIAAMELKEASAKSDVTDFFKQVGVILGPVFGAVLKGLLIA